MKHKTLIGLVFMGIAGTAAAQWSHDTDQDGQLSAAEFAQRSQERFEQLDSDSNGYLTQEEMRSGRGRHGNGRHGLAPRRGFPEHLDTDGDGGLSLAELQVKRPNMTAETFVELDTNGDGLLTRDDRSQGKRRH